MCDDRSRERRQLAAQRLIFAKQMADWRIRASVLGMTQRWLDLAEPREEPDGLDKALRLRAIQTKIGREFRAQYQLPQELPHGILTLLLQINAPPDRENSETAGNGDRLWTHRRNFAGMPSNAVRWQTFGGTKQTALPGIPSQNDTFAAHNGTTPDVQWRIA
jgi:hypothetical protein